MKRKGEVRRVITRLVHGGHAIVDSAPNLDEATAAGAIRLSEVVQEPALADADVKEELEIVGVTDFDYLFRDTVTDPANRLPAANEAEVASTVAALNALGEAMIDQEPPADDRSCPIPPVYTYWGQFIDHDLTAATDNDDKISIRDEALPPLDPSEVVGLLKNARNPALNLDSVYGDGPFAPEPPEGAVRVPYQAQDKAKLEVGSIIPVPIGVRIPPADDLARDLPRIDRVPQIGDARNDENLVVAQLHLAFLRFHNAAVDWVRRHEPERTGVGQVFLRARDLTRWTYQWLCIHDYLTTVTLPETVDLVLGNDDDDLLGLADRKVPYMPLEFSVAAFRFGHSMVRGSYDWNRNFGRPGNNTQPLASFAQLFQFTGRGGFAGGADRLPGNWPIEWNRFVDRDSLFADRFARRIDTHLALPLSQMINQVDDETLPERIQTLLKNLARRNLLRGFRLALPTGQAVAAELGIPALTPQQLTRNVNPAIVQALEAGNFLERTPLWFYVLRESERNAQGDTLGAVGSRIVAETIIGQIRHDPTSYLNQSSWSPSAGVRLPDGSPIRTIADFLRFAGVM
ncbi:MAG TPA: heme peroxidase family protein [Actinoplanes sp.]|nr:heme peroxidase family protein [Actinoplanes sp.]